MSVFLDDFLVGVVLLAGFGYAIYSLGPKPLRACLLAWTAWMFGRLPGTRMRRAAERLAAVAGKSGSCGGCDNCGSDPSTVGRSAPDIKIPLSKIGKRR